jgi:WD40 repeat protein
VATGKEQHRMFQKGGVTEVSFSPDARFLAMVSPDNTVHLWSTATSRELQELTHDDFITDITFSPDGKFLATASSDKTARLWDMATGKELHRLVHGDIVSDVRFSPDGNYVATVGGGDTAARLWLWRPNDLIAEACRRLTRNLSWEEWRQYFENEAYRKTCMNLPIHPSVYWAAQALAGENKIVEAVALLDRVKVIEPNFRKNPQALAQRYLAENLCQYIQFKAAVISYEAADKLDANAVESEDWNNFCWDGALQGHAVDVMEACDQAVQGATKDEARFYQDSRGLARALAGNYPGAIEDFEAFIQNTNDQNWRQQRQEWVDTLRAGKNPFTKEVLKDLQSQ